MPDQDNQAQLIAELEALRTEVNALRSLKKAKDEMEMRVVERTAELISLNQQLQHELDERRQMEEALRVSQARFAGILEIASDAIIAVDAHQRISLFNQGAEKIFGYAAHEVIGQSLDVLLPDRYVQPHRQHVTEFRSSNNHARRMGERREIYGRRKDGTEFPADASISKLEVAGETIYTTILRDVSDRRQAEAALERLSRQNQLILNSVGEGICGVDLQGCITFTNPAAAKLLGYRVEELTGQSIYAILPHTHADGTPYPLEESPILTTLVKGSVCQVTDEVFWRKDSSSFPVEYISTPILEQHQIIGAVVTFRDITERQVVERMKDEFISVVSHELRTPLTSIHGSLGMLASGLLSTDPQTSQRLLEIAVNSTDRLVRLINDILDIERIESGKVKMERQTCKVADLIAEAVDVIQALAARSQVHLGSQAPDLEIWVDPDRIIQTLTNLLSNAIKFSPTESTVWVSAEAQDNDFIRFQVRDQGRGIPPDKLQTIFERFQQVDASDSRNHDGTGLGLAICRSIVHQHGGQIWVESNLGEGSSFYFTLPLIPEEAAAVPLSTAKPPLILVCDDDPSIRRILQTLLERRNYQVVAAASGQEAIDLTLSRRPDAILMDLLMPEMNGWEVMAHLKQRPETSGIPIIICSVASPGQTPPEIGIVNWVGKPVDEVSLFQSLRYALSTSSQRLRVLVIEDDVDLAEILIARLERHEIETFHAASAREAIRLSQQVNPDLLILDLVLPDGDGFDVVEWLQHHNQLNRVPLVVYSAKEVSPVERHALHLGQTEFWQKGQVSPEEFEQRVIQLLWGITQHRTRRV